MLQIFFDPHHYYEEMDCKDAKTRTWLTCVNVKKFGFRDSPIVDIARCLCWVAKFIFLSYKSYPKNNMVGSWDLYGGESEWLECFPCLMLLWKNILVIAVGTTICERGFSKLNRKKMMIDQDFHLTH